MSKKSSDMDMTGDENSNHAPGRPFLERQPSRRQECQSFKPAVGTGSTTTFPAPPKWPGAASSAQPLGKQRTRRGSTHTTTQSDQLRTGSIPTLFDAHKLFEPEQQSDRHDECHELGDSDDPSTDDVDEFGVLLAAIDAVLESAHRIETLVTELLSATGVKRPRTSTASTVATGLGASVSAGLSGTGFPPRK